MCNLDLSIIFWAIFSPFRTIVITNLYSERAATAVFAVVLLILFFF